MTSVERGHVSTSRPTAANEMPLIDRTEEMDQLRQAVDSTVQCKGGIVFIHGEAGIGKTRLTQELIAYARLRGMQVLQGRCPTLFRMNGVHPYGLWSEVIRDYLASSTSKDLYKVIGSYPAEVVKVAPELSRRLESVPQSLPIDPAHEQTRLFEAISQFITNISRETPLLLILDDLQWADPSSLLLLHYVARSIHRTPLLLVAAYRDANVNPEHPLTPVLTELNRERLSQSIFLKRMSADNVSDIIQQLLEQDVVPTEFCKKVYEKTRGNPFFLEEVIRSLKENGIIHREENRWKIAEVSKIEFPESVKSVVKARIDRLDGESRNVLTLASFVGNDFSLEAIGVIAGIERRKLLELMEAMFKTGLIKEHMVRGEAICSFADVLIRDVVYDEVSQFRAKELHGKVGAALEKVWAKKIDEHVGELASHFLESGDREKALDYFLKAGKKAKKIYANSEAFSYFQNALRLLGDEGDNLEQRAKIIEKLGDLKAFMGEIDDGMEYWDKSLTLWSTQANMNRVAKLHIKMAWWLWEIRGNKTMAEEHHKMALDLLEKEPESVDLAALYEDITHMLWRTGKPGEALAWAQKALKLAEQLGASDVQAWCYNDLGVLSLKSGDSEEAQRYYEQGLRIAKAKDLVLPAGTIYSNLCDLYLGIGEIEKCFETAKEGTELTRKSGAFFSLVWIDFQLAGCYARKGEAQKALSILEDIVALDKRTKNSSHLSYALWSLGQVCLWLGDYEKSFQSLTEALELAKAAGEYQSSGDVTVALAELSIEKNDYAMAKNYLDQSSRIWQEARDADGQVLDLFPVLSKFYLKKRELDKARETIERTSEYAIRAKKKMVVCYTDMLKGMLFREQGDMEKSLEHFEKSLMGYKSLNAEEWNVYQFAELLNEYGVTCLERNEDSYRKKAYSLLTRALAIYEKMGAKKKIETILARNIPIRDAENG